MATKYNRKTEAELAFDANKKRLRAEVQLIADELLNQAFSVMSEEFQQAYIRGEILQVEGNREQLLKYLQTATTKVLSA